MKKFIVFEGIDGCGKTTLSKNVATALNCWWTKEPTFSSEQADLLNLKSKNKVEREVEFAVDRIKHGVEINSRNKDVVCDRYIWTGLAYCLKYNESAFEFVKALYSHDFFLKPDYYIFVDTPVEICYQRSLGRTGSSPQSLEDLKKIRDCFLVTREIIEKTSKVFVIQAIGDSDVLVNNVLKEINK